MKRNPHFDALSTNYLFLEINKRKKAYLEQHPEAKLISLGIGDTTLPINVKVTQKMAEASLRLSSQESYFGYGPEQGLPELRESIASQLYHHNIKSEEVFISDGAKCDMGRLQTLFGSQISVAVQDPAYPVYVDGSFLQGISKIHRMPCLPSNGFFPELVPADLIYFASPNNPTGAVATKQQLEELVRFAQKHGSIIIFDVAYAAYIQDPDLPRSIYEIEGAKEVAIEVGSFSKLAGFSGIRLGWTIIPHELKYSCGRSIHQDWSRIVTTIFNGASILSQAGGLAVLKDMNSIQANIFQYLENAKLLKNALKNKGEVYGGENAPYLWVRMKGKDSWTLFSEFLEKYHIVTTPGSGFGPSGEGFLRFSSFGIKEAVERALLNLK